MSASNARRLGLQGKIALTYLVVGLSVSMLGLFSTRAFQRRASLADAARFETTRAAQQLGAVTGSAFEEGLSYVLTGDEVERTACLDRLRELRGMVAYLLAREDLQPTEAAKLTELNRLVLRAEELARRMFGDRAQGTRPTASLEAYEDAMDQLTSETGGLIDAMRARGGVEAAAGRALLEHALLGVALATVLLCVALGSAFGKRLTTPIVKLRDAASAFGHGAGELCPDIPVGDELGDLAEAFRDMAANVRRLVTKEAEHSARLENVFASMQDMVVVVSSEGLVLSVNRSCLATLGYNEAELVGRPLGALFEGDGSSGGMWTRPGKRTRTGSSRMRSKSGGSVPVSVAMTPMGRGAGRGGGVFVAQDLTERQRLEAELRQAQKLEAVGRLASGIAHEINTPVQFASDNVHFLSRAVDSFITLVTDYQRLKAAVAGGGPVEEALFSVTASEVLADLPYLVEEMPRAVAACLDGLGRVATIVRSMKEFAHPGGAEMAASDLNRGVLSTLTMSTYETKLVAEVVTDLAPLPPVFCELGAINQVLLNLVVNAAHAVGDVMKTTGRRGTITVRTRHEAGHAVLSVTDTGAGIPPHVQEHMFEPFFTTKEVGVGTGQGLAIARSVVVERHGGTLTFESEIAVGTTFVVRLPIERSTSRTARAA